MTARAPASWTPGGQRGRSDAWDSPRTTGLKRRCAALHPAGIPPLSFGSHKVRTDGLGAPVDVTKLMDTPGGERYCTNMQACTGRYERATTSSRRGISAPASHLAVTRPLRERRTIWVV
jgi:hypothetical protein